MVDSFYSGERELGIFLSNKELEELNNSGNISGNCAGKNLEVKISEDENKIPLRMNPLGKNLEEVESIELYIHGDAQKILEDKGILKNKDNGNNEVTIYTKNYANIGALNQVYNLKGQDNNSY